MSRHPYTHSCDFIRSSCPSKPLISRGDASQIRRAIAEALGMPDEELAVILSNRFQELNKDPEWVGKQTERTVRRVFGPLEEP
jgi:hypothetical protein